MPPVYCQFIFSVFALLLVTMFSFRYLALSQDEEILIGPDMEAAAGHILLGFRVGNGEHGTELAVVVEASEKSG